MNDKNDNDHDRSGMELLQKIHSGLIEPKNLDRGSRQSCLRVLRFEGYSASQAAAVLKVSEKTILRDLKIMKKANAISPNVQFAKEYAGEFLQRALVHHDYLTRLARTSNGSLSEKTQCEYAAWKILKETVETLQTLGYLPLKPKAGDLYHHIVSEEGDAIGEVKRMLVEIEDVAKDTDTYTPELVEQVSILKARINEAEVVSEVKKLKDTQQNVMREEEEDKENEE